jgi:ATP-binding cassette subfamily B protein
VSGPIGRKLNAGLDAPTARPRDFKGSALRLLKRLTPQRLPTAIVLLLGIVGIAIGVVGPLILGHATDLLFSGVIGRQLPAGITKEQAIEAARARGDGTFADLLSGMNVVPGHGVDFGAVGRTLLLALAGAAAERDHSAHHGGAAVRRRGQGAPAAPVLLRLAAAW